MVRHIWVSSTIEQGFQNADITITRRKVENLYIAYEHHIEISFKYKYI